MKELFDTRNITVGVVGLGLMGSSIAVSLLLSGHKVIAIAPIPGEKEAATLRIKNELILCAEDGLLRKPVDNYQLSLKVSDDYEKLSDCNLVLECVIENVNIKSMVYKKIENAIKSDAIIGTNTSAIPISSLQRFITYPERFIGIHWSEPAYVTRFMEITCGEKTSIRTAKQVYELAQLWGKEPTVLKKDIRGFITNRLMYAVYRESLSLVESGEATLEDVDKAFRYDAGSWMMLMGIFRRMDYLGLKDFEVIFKNIFPELCNNDQIPAFMQGLVEMNASGTRNHKGLYDYTVEEAKNWDEAFAAFNKDIFKLASLYPSEPLDPEFKFKSTK